MFRYVPCLLVVAATVAVLATPRSAVGQPESPSTGELRLLVFVGSEPAVGVTVLVERVGSKDTTEDGTAEFDVPEGTYKPRLWVPRSLLGAMEQRGGPCIIALRDIEVLIGEESEAIVTLGSACEVAKVYVESPGSREGNRAAAKAFEDKLENAPRGTVTGTVVATVEGTEETVAQARVFVRGAPTESETDANGRFSLELPEGTYDLVVIHARYTTANQKAVVVKANETTDLKIAVEKATPQLDDFVVTAPKIEGGVATLVAERRESSSVSDVIGSEQISRSGDSDAAGALKRVTGITVVGGRYVYVRGMGERYSSTLVNNQYIPSPEPERRVVPLDLFSTNILESVVVQKTPSPDAPGEFGGGTVRLRTQSFPEELTASVGVSIGANSQATFQNRPTYDGGSTDFLGIDDGTRAVPSSIADQSPLREGNRFVDGFTQEELAGFARELEASYAIEDSTVPINRGLSATLGTPFDVFGKQAGVLFSLSYDDDFGYREGPARNINATNVSDENPDGLDSVREVEQERAERVVGLAAILAAGFSPAEGHSISSNTIVLRLSNDEATRATGFNVEGGIQENRLRYLEQQVLYQQLIGQHEVGPSKLQWRAAVAQASQDEPDRRQYAYEDRTFVEGQEEPLDLLLSLRPGANQRVFRDLKEQLYDVGADYSHELSVWGDRKLKLKAGGAYTQRNRDFGTIRLALTRGGDAELLTNEEKAQPADVIWAKDNLSPSGWILLDQTQATDSYTADLTIVGGYGMATVPVTSNVEVTAGVRVERARQNVSTFEPFTVEPSPVEAILDDTDPLPSATAKWAISDEIVLRGGYGRSVTRPSFRELSPSQYRDVIEGARFVGNPDLRRGTIDNFDIRGEYYFSTDEIASVGLFYKNFVDPVERIQEAAADRQISWANADGATNVGAEFEFFKRLGFVGEDFEDVFASINIALIRSQVNLGEEARGIATSEERPLQGQSPFAINAQLGYDDAVGTGYTAVFLYNVFGRRIDAAGVMRAPDIYEQPFHQLDFVASKKFDNGLQLRFKAKNLINPTNQFLGGARVQREFKRGRDFSLSLSYDFF